MIETICLRCEAEIISSFAKPGEVTRCRNCGARHILPNSDEGGDWVERSKELQRQDDLRYRKLMPWTFRLWAIFMAMFYLLFRLDTIRGQGTFSKVPFGESFGAILTTAMVLMALATSVWGYFIQIGCYGIPYTLRASIGYIRWRWLVEALLIIALIVAVIEVVTRLL